MYTPGDETKLPIIDPLASFCSHNYRTVLVILGAASIITTFMMVGKKNTAPATPSQVLKSKPVKRASQLPETVNTNGIEPPKDIFEHEFQPEISPYTTHPVTITVGTTRVPYIIPSYFLSQFPQWKDKFGPESYQDALELPGVDEDVGHTFVHYLYTGTYQTVKSRGDSRGVEYRRALLTHAAASAYGLEGLAALAKRPIEQFRSEVSIGQILQIAQSVYANGLVANEWVQDYVKHELLVAYDLDETIFAKPVYLGLLGQVPEFDKLLVKLMAEILNERIALLREKVQGRVERNIPEPLPKATVYAVTKAATVEVLPPEREQQTTSIPLIQSSVQPKFYIRDVESIQASWPFWKSERKPDIVIPRGRSPSGLFY